MKDVVGYYLRSIAKCGKLSQMGWRDVMNKVRDMVDQVEAGNGEQWKEMKRVGGGY